MGEPRSISCASACSSVDELSRKVRQTPFCPSDIYKNLPLNFGIYTMSVLELFCAVDDFWLQFAPQWKVVQLATGKQRERAGHLCPSEMMTILIHFHLQTYAASRDCKRLFQLLRSFQNPFSAQQCLAVTYDALLLRTRTSAHS